MNYIISKLTFLLCEYYYNKNAIVEKDLCKVIYDLENENWNSISMDFDQCLKILRNIPPKYSEQPYSWVQSQNDFIQYLEYLPVDIAENQADRQIAYAEAISDYIYENGYDTFMNEGF